MTAAGTVTMSVGNMEGRMGDDAAVREAGFYWVLRCEGSDPEVMQWWDALGQRHWLDCGGDVAIADDEVHAVISPRLTPAGTEDIIAAAREQALEEAAVLAESWHKENEPSYEGRLHIGVVKTFVRGAGKFTAEEIRALGHEPECDCGVCSRNRLATEARP